MNRNLIYIGSFWWFASHSLVIAEPESFQQQEITGIVKVLFEATNGDSNYLTVHPFEQGELTPMVVHIVDEAGKVQYIHFMKTSTQKSLVGKDIFGTTLVIDKSELPVAGTKYRFTVTKSSAGLLRAISMNLLENPVPVGDPAFRRKQIDYLIRHVEFELDEYYDRGFVDGTGLLYQMTPTYLRLLDCCTDLELREIHNKIIPAARYVPASRRDSPEVDVPASLLESEVDSIFAQTIFPFRPLYVEVVGEGLIPYPCCDPARLID